MSHERRFPLLLLSELFKTLFSHRFFLPKLPVARTRESCSRSVTLCVTVSRNLNMSRNFCSLLISRWIDPICVAQPLCTVSLYFYWSCRSGWRWYNIYILFFLFQFDEMSKRMEKWGMSQKKRVTRIFFPPLLLSERLWHARQKIKREETLPVRLVPPVEYLNFVKTHCDDSVRGLVAVPFLFTLGTYAYAKKTDIDTSDSGGPRVFFILLFSFLFLNPHWRRRRRRWWQQQQHWKQQTVFFFPLLSYSSSSSSCSPAPPPYAFWENVGRPLLLPPLQCTRVGQSELTDCASRLRYNNHEKHTIHILSHDFAL